MAGGYRAFYLPLKAEFFVPLGDDIEELFTKRTRFTAGLGYVVDKSWTLEPERVNAHGGFLRKTTTSIPYFRLNKRKRQLLLLEKLARVGLLQSLSSEHINTLVKAALFRASTRRSDAHRAG